MIIDKSLLRMSALFVLLASTGLADHVMVDYDHHANFDNYKTYSLGKIETANSIWSARVRDAIEKDLSAKGWTEIPSGGRVTVVATETTRTQPEVNTFYDGFGGRRWGGFGDATTTVQNYKVGTLVIDMYDAGSKNLIWRGSSSSALTGNPEKNAKNLDKDMQKMFDHFPPAANKA
jgi:Domain of unknown function (DUF4136)